MIRDLKRLLEGLFTIWEGREFQVGMASMKKECLWDSAETKGYEDDGGKVMGEV